MALAAGDLSDQRVDLKLLLELVHVRALHRNVHAGAFRKHFSGRNRVPCPRVLYGGVHAYEILPQVRAALDPPPWLQRHCEAPVAWRRRWLRGVALGICDEVKSDLARLIPTADE